MKHVPVTKAQLTHIYEIHIHFLLLFFFLVLHASATSKSCIVSNKWSVWRERVLAGKWWGMKKIKQNHNPTLLSFVCSSMDGWMVVGLVCWLCGYAGSLHDERYLFMYVWTWNMNTKWKCRFNIVSKKKLERTANCGWIKTDSIVAECKFVKPRLASCSRRSGLFIEMWVLFQKLTSSSCCGRKWHCRDSEYRMLKLNTCAIFHLLYL